MLKRKTEHSSCGREPCARCSAVLGKAVRSSFDETAPFPFHPVGTYSLKARELAELALRLHVRMMRKTTQSFALIEGRALSHTLCLQMLQKKSLKTHLLLILYALGSILFFNYLGQ